MDSHRNFVKSDLTNYILDTMLISAVFRDLPGNVEVRFMRAPIHGIDDTLWPI
jgi:hypothetical protein